MLPVLCNIHGISIGRGVIADYEITLSSGGTERATAGICVCVQTVTSGSAVGDHTHWDAPSSLQKFGIWWCLQIYPTIKP